MLLQIRMRKRLFLIHGRKSKMADEEEDLQELRRAVISSIPEKSKDVRVVKSSGKSRSHRDTKDHRHDSHREKERRKRPSDENSDLRHQLSRRDRDSKSRKVVDQEHRYHHKVIDQKHHDHQKVVDQRDLDHHKMINQKHYDHHHHKSSRVASQVQVIRKDDAEKPFLITVKNDISNRGQHLRKKTRDDSGDEVGSRDERTLSSVIQQIDQQPRKREGRDSEEGGDSSDMDSDYTFEMRSQKHSDDEDSVYSVEFKNIGGSDDEASSRGEGSGKGSDEESGNEDEDGDSDGSKDKDAPDIEDDPEFENVRLEDNDDESSGEDERGEIDGGDAVVQNGGPAHEEAEKPVPKRMVTVQHKKKDSTVENEQLSEREERAPFTEEDQTNEIGDQGTHKKTVIDLSDVKAKEIVVKDGAVAGKEEKTRKKVGGKDDHIEQQNRSNKIKEPAEQKVVGLGEKEQGKELDSKEGGKERRRAEIKDTDTTKRGTEVKVKQMEERDSKGTSQESNVGKGRGNIMKIAYIGKDKKEAFGKKNEKREVVSSNAGKRNADAGKEIRREAGIAKEARKEASKDDKDVGKSVKGVDIRKSEWTSSKRLSAEEKTETARSANSVGEEIKKGGDRHRQAEGGKAKAAVEKHVQKDRKRGGSKEENYHSRVHSQPEKEVVGDAADKTKPRSSKNQDQNQGEKVENFGPSNSRKASVKTDDFDKEKDKREAKADEKNKTESDSKSYSKKKNDLGKSSSKSDDVKSDSKKNSDDKESVGGKKGKGDAKLEKAAKSSRAGSSSVSLGKVEDQETRNEKKRNGGSKLKKEAKPSRKRSSSSSSGDSSSSDSSSSDSDSDSESSKSSRSGSESSSGSSESSSSDSSSSSSEEANFKRRRKRNSEIRNVNIDRRRKSKSPRKDTGRGYVSPLRTDRSEWGKKSHEIDDRNGRDRDRSRDRNYHGVTDRPRGRSREYSRERIRHRTRSRSNDHSRQRRGDFSKESERRIWERGDYKGLDNRDSRRESYNRRDNDRGAYRAERRSLERARDRYEKPRDRYERPRDRDERPRDRVERSRDRDVRSRDRDRRSRDRGERPRDRDVRQGNRDERSRDRNEWANNRVDKPRDRVERSGDGGERPRGRDERSRDRDEGKRNGSKDRKRDEGIEVSLEWSNDRSERAEKPAAKARSRNDSENHESKERDPERLPDKTEEKDERPPRRGSRTKSKDVKEDHSSRSDKVEEIAPKPLMEKKIDVTPLKGDKEPDRRRTENGRWESRDEVEGPTRNTNDRKESNSRNDNRETKDGVRRERAVNAKISEKERFTNDVKPRPLMEITLPNVKKLEARVDRRPSRRVSLTQRNRSRNLSDDDLRSRRNPRRPVSIDDELNSRKRSAEVDHRDIRDSRENRARSPKRHIIDNSARVKRLSSGKTVLVDQRRLEPLMKPMEFTFGVVEEQAERLENRKTTRRVVTESGNDLKAAVVEVSLDEKDHPQPKRKVFSRLGKSRINKAKNIAINLKVESVGKTPQPEVNKEEEQELDQRIKQIRERNEEIMRRKKEIEDDIKLHS